MKVENKDFPTGDSIPFPYDSPYPEQISLMDSLLEALKLRQEDKECEEAAIMLLESPTGTGKSLSLACAAMAWLRYMEAQDLKPVEGKTNAESMNMSNSDAGGLDWLNSYVTQEERIEQDTENQVRKMASNARADLDKSLGKIREAIRDENPERRNARRENALRASILAAKMRERRKNRRKRPLTDLSTANNNDHCLEEYHSETDLQKEVDDSNTFFDDTGCASASSSESPLILGKALDGSKWNGSKAFSVGNVKPGSGVRKIIYAARTHSQLTQFIGELKRTSYKDIRAVALGGRKALCGNPSVRGKSERAINETCLDLQKSSVNRCPLLDSRDAVDALAQHLLVQPTDIEEAASLGDSSQTCSYYASRRAIAAAEVVVLPYPMLLSDEARSAVGLSLKGSLVLIDEAHNLPEVLRSIHSCRLSLEVIQLALSQHSEYVQRYSDRLSGRNLHYLGQIKKLLVAFRKHLENPNSITGNDELVSPGELLIQLKLDTVNLVKICNYLKRSRLSQKLLGFNSRPSSIDEEDADKSSEFGSLSKHVSAMSVVEAFIEKLCHSGKEGKVATDRQCGSVGLNSESGEQRALRYVLLSPSAFFENIKKESFALALVGGTLKPFLHVVTELFHGDDRLPKEAELADKRISAFSEGIIRSVSSRFTAFSCGHVVPSSNILLKCITRSPIGSPLDFRHQSRLLPETCTQLGEFLFDIAQQVPCGLVIFLPSYSYELSLVRHWQSSGLWKRLGSVKKLHREPRKAKYVDTALQAFSRDASQGALLFSVIGGKMSEGINFANDMARGVVVVGLPYPDITDPVLKEKMQSIDESTDISLTGQSYYQNLCMRGKCVRLRYPLFSASSLTLCSCEPVSGSCDSS